jgi:hypothetical protein
MIIGLAVFLFAVYIIIVETTGDHRCTVDYNPNDQRVHAYMQDKVYTIAGSFVPNVCDYLRVRAEPAVYLFAAVGLTILILGTVQLRGILQRQRLAPSEGAA